MGLLEYPYMNAVLQLIAHIPPLRNFLLLHNQNNDLAETCLVTNTVSLLCRKMWNRKAFKDHISPLHTAQTLLSELVSVDSIENLMNSLLMKISMESSKGNSKQTNTPIF